jgi:hypothetical protein
LHTQQQQDKEKGEIQQKLKWRSSIRCVEIIGLRVGDTSNDHRNRWTIIIISSLYSFYISQTKIGIKSFLFKSYLNMWVKYKLRLHFVQIVQLWQLNKYVMRINDLKDFHPSIICYIVAWTNHSWGYGIRLIVISFNNQNNKSNVD